MDKFCALISSFRSDIASYDPSKLRAVMDSFRDVLFTHLDQEVKDLLKDNMIRYVCLPPSCLCLLSVGTDALSAPSQWTLDEVRRLPI